MKSISFGKITQYKYDKKKYYKVKIFNKIKADFADIKSALKFVKYHAKTLHTISEDIKADILYKDIKGEKHYIILSSFENEKGVKDFIVHEETTFEYMRTHPHKFSIYSKRRLINDWNYSFPDIARSVINWPVRFSIFLMLISVILIFSSATLLIFVLNFIEVNKGNTPFLNSWINLIFAYTFFCMPILLTAVTFWEFFNAKPKLYDTRNDYQNIDWWKWYRLRIKYILSVLFISIAGITFISIFLYEDRNLDNPKMEIAIFVNYGIWFILFISILIFLFCASIRKSKNLRTYYTVAESEKFKLWIRKKNKPEIRKSNENMFLFKSKYSSPITRIEIDKSDSITEKMNSNDLSLFKKEFGKEDQWAKKEYLKLYKEVKKRVNISKNN